MNDIRKFLTAIFIVTSPLAPLSPLFTAEKRVERAISLQDRYSHVLEVIQKQQWKEVILEGKQIISQSPYSPFALEVRYLMGIAYFKLGDFENANNFFSDYLKNQTSPQYFEEALGYKFAIAQKFEEGARRRIMGWKHMPKWMPAKEVALGIYDEIITSLPRHDLAAQSLYRKGYLLYQIKEYKQGIEAFQSLIRRFPKHPLAPESYLGIAHIYLKQCQTEFPDPDFLDLAEIQLKKFKQDFPGEPKVAKAEELFDQMKEMFAKELYDIGKFYERTKKPDAAGIYYKTVMVKYPQTKCCIKSKKRLIALNIPVPELDPSKSPSVIVETNEN